MSAIKELLPCETVDLSELMVKLRGDDFLYDETALSLVELYIEFRRMAGSCAAVDGEIGRTPCARTVVG